MREIKFRAWNDKSKEMFDVDVLAINPVMWDSGGTGVSLAYQPHIKIMQYTGLKDKNGTEIYEGDILKFTVSDYVYVSFYEGKYITIATYEGKYTARSDFEDMDLDEALKSGTVVGNIYENPELLEESK